MNELKQIRTMAELILEKVDALEGATSYTKDIGFDHLAREYKAKFKVGDRVTDNSELECTVTKVGKEGICLKTDDGSVAFVAHKTAESWFVLDQSSDRVWHSGPPPHVGWWLASYSKHPDTWRWWDGNAWSAPAFNDYSAKQAGIEANKPAIESPKAISWCNYWPENARVPRLNPAEHEEKHGYTVLYLGGDKPGHWQIDPVTGDMKHLGY